MAWLAVNKNGTETISPGKPNYYWHEWIYSELECIESEYGDISKTIDIPKGTIEKILGRVITWEDGPIEF